MAFDKSKYINQYKKEHYSKLSVDLTKEMKQELVDICNRQGITIKKFILDALQEVKKKEKTTIL